MAILYSKNTKNERIATNLDKKQGIDFFNATQGLMEKISDDLALLWEVNFEMHEYFDLDCIEPLSPQLYQTVVQKILTTCAAKSELKAVYEPIKTALMSDKRFQAA